MAKQKNVPITSAARPASAPASDDKGKLGVLALAGVVVSSMIGGGIYSLPQNMAAGASVGAVILALDYHRYRRLFSGEYVPHFVGG